jgi:sulfur carrier protein
MALTEEITIQLNGATTHVRVGCTVAELVAATLPNARAFAVEVNRAVLSRREHASHEVRDGDSVEIVTLVGGG